MSELIRHDRQCRLCGSESITTVFRLTRTPPGDHFVCLEKKNAVQQEFLLDLALCRGCGYVHLPYVLDPTFSYADYTYLTKVSQRLAKQYDSYADDLIRSYSISRGTLVVDIGSNDGTMLEGFQRKGMRVLGVEPAEAIAQVANSAGVPTIGSFFDGNAVSTILSEYGPVSVVSANYVYANVDDLICFTRDVARCMAPDGLFVVQTGYHPEQMKIKMFDYIYHEHFSYFTVRVLKSLLTKCGLELIDVKKTPEKGGSIRAIGQLATGPRQVQPSVDQMIQEEQDARMSDGETYRLFALEIGRARERTRELLHERKRSGKRIVGYGASHSTTTLTYHFGLAEFMEYLVDDNPLKHGMFSPGNHLPVHPSSKLYEDRPDCALVLAWQYQDRIMESNQHYCECGGEFIVPLPELRYR